MLVNHGFGVSGRFFISGWVAETRDDLLDILVERSCLASEYYRIQLRSQELSTEIENVCRKFPSTTV